MSPPRRHSPIGRSSEAFTLVEVLVYTALLMSLSVAGFRSMFTFTEEQKLRMAAIELSSYLEVARNVALSENIPCVIALKTSDGGVFAEDTTSTTNSCLPGKINSSLNLRELTGSKKLQIESLPGAGNFPLTFNPEGTTRSGVTVLISSSDVNSGAWCVDVQAPLATVRMGWSAKGANFCRYAVEQ
jgi:Tfp pilus assembly protein FimT